MTIRVLRTCTEIREAGPSVTRDLLSSDSIDWHGLSAGQESGVESDSDSDSDRSYTLDALREGSTYVLLGAPGAGKTIEFKGEAERTGSCYVTARDFLTFDDRPEWRDTTLFIDGLDEIRAGSPDGRTPLDSILDKINTLGRPRFRLSCREADWFGANDRVRLESIARDGKVRVLRLDPLSDDGIREILNLHAGIEDVDGFVATARERGIDGLLTIPQSLEMLAEAVADGAWPNTRLQTFELACEKLVRECNREHRIANRDGLAASNLIDAAGRLCAVQLLTGSTGYVVNGGRADSGYVPLEDISGDHDHRETLRRTLSINLFRSPEEDRRSPAHRQIAEFLASRYLAELIDRDSFPVRRVLAMMMSGDGRIVSELRGLSAWLAAHSRIARTEIVERDPLGTILYGDVGEFSREEKYKVLISLEREAKRNPWFANSLVMDARLGNLAAFHMEDVFREQLNNRARDAARQTFIFILLQSLVHGREIPELTSLLIEIVRDETWLPKVRGTALDVLLREQGQGTTDELRILLTDVHAGSVLDSDDDLLGSLLMGLYPDRLSGPEIWRYLKTPKNQSYFGRYWLFWTKHLPTKSTSAQITALFDALVAQFDRLRPILAGERLQSGRLGGLPVTLLARLLETSQETIPAERLFDWLGVASNPELRCPPEAVESATIWLNSHPDTQKEMVKTGVARCIDVPDFSHCMNGVARRFFHAIRPADFGHWCLEQAIAGPAPVVAGYFLRKVAESVHFRRYDEGLSREVVKQKLADKDALLLLFKKRLAALEEIDVQEKCILESENTEKDTQRRKWRDNVRSCQAALSENRCAPILLDQLASVYFGWYVDVKGDTPLDRLRDLLDNDDLVNAVLDGLRGSVNRSDLPTAMEIIRIDSEGRRHCLALPFLAGMEELAQTSSKVEASFSEEQIRQVFAFHYTVFGSADQNRNWYKLLLKSHAGTAADVLVSLVRTEIRNGREHFFGVYRLTDSDEVARLVSLPLLQAFPVRCTTKQIEDLSYMLRTALRHCETEKILGLVERKLASRSMNAAQRIQWLSAALFASATSASAASYREQLEEFVAGSERRVRYLADFVVEVGNQPFSALIRRLDVSVTQFLVRLMATTYRPGFHPFDSRSVHVRTLIERIASIPTRDATEALKTLSNDGNVRPWRPYFVDAVERQNAARQEADFRHCSVSQVLETLDNRRPGNVADLSALTFDVLTEISGNIRNGSTNDWRQYWNPDGAAQRWKPKHENECRDVLLSDIRYKLGPLRVDAAPEGRYAEERRSDIRVSYGGFNVPVEIKKNNHRDLWSAIRNQLIEKYTRDPDADGYGIYLVLWFGKECCQPPESGVRPNSAAELEERLRDTLSSEEARLISIVVVDVARP